MRDILKLEAELDEEELDYNTFTKLENKWKEYLYKEYGAITKDCIDAQVEQALREGVRDITIVMDWIEQEAEII